MGEPYFTVEAANAHFFGSDSHHVVRVTGDFVEEKAFASSYVTGVEFEGTVVRSSAFQRCPLICLAWMPHCEVIEKCAFLKSGLRYAWIPNVKCIGSNAFSQSNVVILHAPVLKSIGMNTFNGCANLVHVDLGVLENLRANSFSDCISLKTVSLKNTREIGLNAFGNCVSLVHVNIPRCKKLDVSAFEGCIKLETVIGNVEHVGYRVFSTCYSLTHVDFSSCKSISNLAASKTTSLETVRFGSRLIIIDEMCFYMSAISEVNIDAPYCILYKRAFSYSMVETVQVSVKSMEDGVFFKCKRLLSVKLNVKDSVVPMQTFQYCDNLKEVHSSCKEFQKHCFGNCKDLHTCNIPNATDIGEGAFYRCLQLRTLPRVLHVTKLSVGVFADCTSLSELPKLPNLETVEMSALSGSGISQFCIPTTVNYISCSAWLNCHRLHTVRWENRDGNHVHKDLNLAWMSTEFYPSLHEMSVYTESNVNIACAVNHKIAESPKMLLKMKFLSTKSTLTGYQRACLVSFARSLIRHGKIVRCRIPPEMVLMILSMLSVTDVGKCP